MMEETSSRSSRTEEAEWWEPLALGVVCTRCKAPPGQPCSTVQKPFHACRIDRGVAVYHRRQAALEALL